MIWHCYDRFSYVTTLGGRVELASENIVRLCVRTLQGGVWGSRVLDYLLWSCPLR